MRALFIASFLLAGQILTGQSVAQAQTLPVGLERMRVPERTASLRGDPSAMLQITIWYPARAGTKQADQTIGKRTNPLFLTGRWQEHAAPLMGRRFPIIAISHGTGGSALQMAWLAAPLAADGYIVVAVDHPGNSLALYTPAGFGLWWLRARDITLAIDTVLRSPRWKPLVDPKHIGAAGFSLGGYTVLELAGARTDLARFATYCKRTRWSACDGPPELPHSETQLRVQAEHDKAIARALSEAGRSYRDPRIQAIFAIAPAVVPAIRPDSLKGIAIPAFVVAGRGDPLVSPWENAVAAARLMPTAQLFLFSRSVVHYTFLDQCTALAHAMLPSLCATPGFVQSETHAQTVWLASHFFKTSFSSLASGQKYP